MHQICERRMKLYNLGYVEILDSDKIILETLENDIKQFFIGKDVYICEDELVFKSNKHFDITTREYLQNIESEIIYVKQTNYDLLNNTLFVDHNLTDKINEYLSVNKMAYEYYYNHIFKKCLNLNIQSVYKKPHEPHEPHYTT